MKNLILYFCLFSCLSTFAQKECPYFIKYIDKGDSIIKQGDKADFQAAINAYSTAMLHCPSRAQEAREKILQAFKAIEQLKRNAEAAKKDALLQKDKAIAAQKLAEEKTTLAESNYLISEAKSVESTDPTMALRLVEQAMKKDQDNENKRTYAAKLYRENMFYKEIIKPENSGEKVWVAFSPDAKLIAIGDRNRSIKLLNLQNELVRRFATPAKKQRGAVQDIQFSPLGQEKIYAKFSNGYACIWNLQGQLIKQDFFVGKNAKAAFSPNGNYIISGEDIGSITLWSIDSNKNVLDVIDATKGVDLVDTVGKEIFTASPLKKISGTNEANISLTVGPVYALDPFFIETIDFSNDGKILLLGLNPSGLATVDLERLQITHRLYFGLETGLSCRFAPNGQSILYYHEYGDPAIFATNPFPNSKEDLRAAKDKISFTQDTRITTTAFSADSKYVVIGTNSGTTFLFSKNLSQETFVLKHPSIKNLNSYANLASQPDLGFGDFGSGGYGTPVNTSNEISAAAFSSADDYLLTASNNGTIYYWYLKGLDVTLQYERIGEKIGFNRKLSQKIEPFADSTSIISPNRECQLIYKNAQNPYLLSTKGKRTNLYGCSGNTTSMAFSPDGKLVIVGTNKSTAHIWDIEGNYIQSLKFPQGFWSTTPGAPVNIDEFIVAFVAFSNDSKTIISKSYISRGASSQPVPEESWLIQYWNAPLSLKDFLNSDKLEPLSQAEKSKYGLQ